MNCLHPKCRWTTHNNGAELRFTSGSRGAPNGAYAARHQEAERATSRGREVIGALGVVRKTRETSRGPSLRVARRVQGPRRWVTSASGSASGLSRDAFEHGDDLGWSGHRSD
jgi:hypothetical protein